MDGLVHVSEIAHQHVGKPSDALTVGEDVQVKILSINPEEGRISLSIKETLPDHGQISKQKQPLGLF